MSIKVIDSVPGSGKTSWAIQHINSLDENTRVIYITPYLDEVKRIIDSCPNKEFVQPEVRGGQGSKLKHLIKLVAEGKNVVSTHALFMSISDELIDALRANNYILILDEVFQTVEKYAVFDGYRTKQKDLIERKDVETLVSKELIKIEDDYKVVWTSPDNYLSKYSNFISLCERELIYYVNESLLLWTFPIEVFRDGIFSAIYILTHRFDSQIQSYYYQYFELEYEKCMAKKVDEPSNEYPYGKFDIFPYEPDEDEWKRNIAKNIIIVDNPKMNQIGNTGFQYNRSLSAKVKNTALSKTWFRNNPELVKILKQNLDNFFKNINKGKQGERLWTCFKDDMRTLSGKNIAAKHWLSCNARATNTYQDRTVVAYLINRYVDPFYEAFFEKKGIYIDQDEYALSEMIQWIWRSAIRNGKKIHLYIPSSRMRYLLTEYLGLDPIL